MPNEACFLYILEGEYNSISEEEQLRIKTNESVLMKCGNYLSQMFSRSSPKRYEAVAVHFFPDILQKIYGHSLPGYLKQHNYTFHSNMVKVEASILIKKYVESLLFYFENPKLITEDLLILKLKEIILLLLQTANAPQVIEILTNLFSKRTFSLKEIVEAHLLSPITIPELAQLTNLSLSTFKREFKRIYRDSPGNYIRRKKIERASELLLVSDETITNIAYDCGFSDVAHFSKSFKMLKGISPSEYRLSLIHNKMD